MASRPTPPDQQAPRPAPESRGGSVLRSGDSAGPGRQLAAELGRLLGPDLTISLVGRSHDKLQVVAAAARRHCPAARIETAGETAAGVAGADLVLHQVRVGGLDGRAWDEKAPTEFGMIGEETVGAPISEHVMITLANPMTVTYRPCPGRPATPAGSPACRRSLMARA